MKKFILSIFFTPLLYAQNGKVGINTTEPKETLEINGTAKISNLPQSGIGQIYNGNNNQNTPYVGSKTVIANDNGVLGSLDYLPAKRREVLSGVDGLDAFPNSRTVRSRNGIAGEYVIRTENINIDRKSMVYISANLSVTGINNYNGNLLTDGATKSYAMFVSINDSPLISRNFPFINSGSSYVFGEFYLGGSRYIILEPGTYTIRVKVGVFANEGDMNGISATFAGAPDEYLDIIATPIDY